MESKRVGYIHWSQPEIVLYDDEPRTRISYPDFIEQEGKYFISETQKTIARIHEVDAALLEAMWNQHDNDERAERGLVFEVVKPGQRQGRHLWSFQSCQTLQPEVGLRLIYGFITEAVELQEACWIRGDGVAKE